MNKASAKLNNGARILRKYKRQHRALRFLLSGSRCLRVNIQH